LLQGANSFTLLQEVLRAQVETQAAVQREDQILVLLGAGAPWQAMLLHRVAPIPPITILIIAAIETMR
jgi:hypothetical protein